MQVPPGRGPSGPSRAPRVICHRVQMNSDPAPNLDAILGAGLVGILIAIVVYLAVLALSLWIGYLIMKAAVRNGLREHTMWLETRRGPLR